MATQTLSVAANVRAEVARRGLRHADLADALGISRPAMSRRLTGEMTFDVDELRAVAAYLGVSTADLLAEAVAASP